MLVAASLSCRLCRVSAAVAAPPCLIGSPPGDTSGKGGESMTCKRVIALYAVFVLLACAMLLRLALLASDPQYRAASADQSTAELTAVVKRPHFYDRGGQPITGTASGCLAVAVPGNPASYNILRALGEEQAEAFRERMQRGTPFLVPLDEQLPAHSLVTCLPSGGRTVPPLYSHLIGYLAWDGTGAAGLESAFEGMLAASSRRVRLRYPVDAMGSLLPDTLVSVVDEGAVSVGVLLTVDTRVQQAADDAAAHMRKGAVVVLDCRSGEILAMVSRPAYSADRVAEYLSDPDGALVNRALAQYSIGSVFKLVVQAAALEAGISADWAYTCTGSIAVGDTVFSCAGGGVHGELTMSGALAQSCNCYHIALAQLLGPRPIRTMAVRLGFGRALTLAEGYRTAAGLLPTESQLADTGEFSNFSFGQGRLMANPIQLAAAVAAIANGGRYTEPSLVLSAGEVSGWDWSPPHESSAVMSGATAEALCRHMCAVLTEGTAAPAAPRTVSAAGKTGTAESGEYTGGREKIVSTFAGFFPADNPKYVAVVVSERDSDADPVAIRVFTRLAETLYPAEL